MPKKLVFTEEEQAKLNIMFEGWMISDHERKIGNFLKLNETVEPNNIVFAGDSITEGYPISEMFPNEYIIYNRGISAITSDQLLNHIDTHVLSLNPSKVFILIGTNDLERIKDNKITLTNIEKIIEVILEYNENIEVYLISIYPVNENKKFKDGIQSRLNKDIKTLNDNYQRIASNYKKVIYIDLYNELLSKDGLNENYTYDGLHLNIDGYRFITSKLIKYL